MSFYFYQNIFLMHPIEFYIDGLNHELNLYLLSAQILDEHPQGELFGMFTCGAHHDGYEITVNEEETCEIYCDPSFRRMIDNVVKVSSIRKEKSDFVKMKFFEEAKVLREQEQKLIEEIFRVQRKLFFSEAFFERSGLTTILMKPFGNTDFQYQLLSEILYYQNPRPEIRKVA